VGPWTLELLDPWALEPLNFWTLELLDPWALGPLNSAAAKKTSLRLFCAYLFPEAYHLRFVFVAEFCLNFSNMSGDVIIVVFVVVVVAVVVVVVVVVLIVVVACGRCCCCRCCCCCLLLWCCGGVVVVVVVAFRLDGPKTAQTNLVCAWFWNQPF
jgi:hypothetical protein